MHLLQYQIIVSLPFLSDGEVVEESITTNPYSDVDIKYIPAFLMQMINERFLMREPEKLYELQFSSFANPPRAYNFKCYHHLEKMRESSAFLVYFVITDSLFCFFPLVICAFSLVRFFQELKKSVDFHQRMAGESKPAQLKIRGDHDLNSTFTLM